MKVYVFVAKLESIVCEIADLELMFSKPPELMPSSRVIMKGLSALLVSTERVT